MFYYYKYNNKVLFSLKEHRGFVNINEEMARTDNSTLYFLGKLPPGKSRMSFILSDSDMFYLDKESMDLLNCPEIKRPSMSWLSEKIKGRQIVYINTAYEHWESALEKPHPKKWNIHIVALGDIGSTLLTGLKLLGGDKIANIGIFDRKMNNMKRWEFEMNQITPPFNYQALPDVRIINEDQLMSCDLLIFCAAKGYGLDNSVSDVRMAQYQQNSDIISTYAQKARAAKFKGIFAILSDPVDLLCKKVFLESNYSSGKIFDYKGLKPDQIRGFGLGVMNSRAVYYANKYPKYHHYIKEGRAFGPHGTGLVIADSIEHYNNDLSIELTDLTVKANLKMRALGFKPYIAPALSSGVYSILAMISGQWHYSSTFLGGVYMGANNRLINDHTELERLKLPEKLMDRIKASFDRLSIL